MKPGHCFHSTGNDQITFTKHSGNVKKKAFGQIAPIADLDARFYVNYSPILPSGYGEMVS